MLRGGHTVGAWDTKLALSEEGLDPHSGVADRLVKGEKGRRGLAIRAAADGSRNGDPFPPSIL